MKRTLFLLSFIAVLFINTASGQWFELRCTFSTPGVTPSIFNGNSNPALDQLNQRFAAQSAALDAAYDRQVGRFDRKLAISSQVAAKMNITYPNVSKYPRTKQLYERCAKEYKKLEELSQGAAQTARQRADLATFNQQQEEIIEKALFDYHKAQDLIELADNKAEIIKTYAQNLAIQKSLTAAEKTDLNTAIDKIKFAEAQIKKLNLATDPLKKTARDLERKQLYQTIGQSVVFVSKVIEKTIDLINPTDLGSAALLSQTMVEKYIESNIEKGNSPEVAIREAFEEGYKDALRDQLLGAFDPIEKLSKVPLMAQELAGEIEKWDTIEKNQRSTLKKIDEVVLYSKDGVRRNQELIDRSTVKAKVIIDNAIKRYLSKPGLP